MKEPDLTLIEVTYAVKGIHCSHCGESITQEVEKMRGVSDISVDVDAKTVLVRGAEFEDAAVRAAIEEAGYEAES
jgi:copper chaperone